MTALREALVAAWLFGIAGTAAGAGLKFSDPTGDDRGPGTYTYPTDAVYTQGSFDLVQFEVSDGQRPSFSVTLNERLADPWGMGVGFAIQMIFIFIDKDGIAGSGHTEGLAGLNLGFTPESAWDKVVILSPQPQSRVLAEVRLKAAGLVDDVIVPRRTTGAGRTISARVGLDELGGGDPSSWGYQVIVQSNDGLPGKGELLTRKVDEFEGPHRFGGGRDGDCDPQVLDLLAGHGSGAPDEVQAQYRMLHYECGAEGESLKPATISMVRK
jgi:hypothetical protein